MPYGQMVRRIATAVAAELGRQDVDEPFTLGDDLRLDYIDQGDIDLGAIGVAILSAMREPTEIMARVSGVRNGWRLIGDAPKRHAEMILAADAQGYQVAVEWLDASHVNDEGFVSGWYISDGHNNPIPYREWHMLEWYRPMPVGPLEPSNPEPPALWRDMIDAEIDGNPLVAFDQEPTAGTPNDRAVLVEIIRRVVMDAKMPTGMKRATFLRVPIEVWMLCRDVVQAELLAIADADTPQTTPLIDDGTEDSDEA